MKIIIGADHGGVKLKSHLIKFLENNDIGTPLEVINVGANTEESIDYPDIVDNLVNQFNEKNHINSTNDTRGILICKSGIGMSIAANKYPGIRAALVFNEKLAKSSVAHNHANVLCLGANQTDHTTAIKIIKKFLTTMPESGRHQKRVNKINKIS